MMIFKYTHCSQIILQSSFMPFYAAPQDAAPMSPNDSMRSCVLLGYTWLSSGVVREVLEKIELRRGKRLKEW